MLIASCFFLCIFLFNLVLLKCAKNPSTLFHLTIAFLPFLLSLPVGIGVHNLIFLLLGIFYLSVKMYATEFASKHERLVTSSIGFFGFIGMYSLLGHFRTIFGIYVIIELIFLLSLMLIVGTKSSDEDIELYFVPNLLVGMGIGIMLCFIIFSIGHGELHAFEQYANHLATNKYRMIHHVGWMVFMYLIATKLYIYPGNYVVPILYQKLTTTQVAIFSTVFTLPYLYITSLCLSPLPENYKVVLYLLVTLTMIWCMAQLAVENRVRAIIGLLTVFTQNVLVFILISGPTEFNNHQEFLCLSFFFFYLLSVMPFLYLLSKSNCETVLDVRLSLFLMNTFKSYIFYLSWLALAGIPITFLYVTKIATITYLLGLVHAGIALWIYLVFSFYIYVVFFIFIMLTKEIYLIHKKDARTTSALKDQPWVRRSVGILPWVLLIVLFTLFVLVAISFY